MKKQEIIQKLKELKNSKFMAMQNENNVQKYAKLNADIQRCMRAIGQIEAIEFSEKQSTATEQQENATQAKK